MIDTSHGQVLFPATGGVGLAAGKTTFPAGWENPKLVANSKGIRPENGEKNQGKDVNLIAQTMVS